MGVTPGATFFLKARYFVRSITLTLRQDLDQSTLFLHHLVSVSSKPTLCKQKQQSLEHQNNNTTTRDHGGSTIVRKSLRLGEEDVPSMDE